VRCARRSRWSAEAGLAAGAEALVLGMLVFVVGTLVAVTTWAAIDTRFATAAAAREGARAAATTPPGEGPLAAAEAAVVAALEGHGLDPGRAELELHGPVGASLERCQEVSVTVTYRLDAVRIPVIDVTALGFDVNGRHTEVVDPFRSGLAVGGSCAF
jgi:hypothetical protein